MTENGREEEEIKGRILKGSRGLGSMRWLMHDKDVKGPYKVTLYKTIVRSTVLNRNEVWTIDKSPEENLERWESKWKE